MNKDSTITVRINVKDKERLEQNAKSAKATLSAYCISLLVHHRALHPAMPVCDTIMIAELNRVGRLLAQCYKAGKDTSATDKALRDTLFAIKNEVQRRKFQSIFAKEKDDDNQKNQE